MKTFSKIITIIVILLNFQINAAYSETIRIGIEPNKHLTTLRVQSFSGKWKLHMEKYTATDTVVVQEEIATSEDCVFMLIPKGIVIRMSSEKNLELGFDKIFITSGDLISVELPGLSTRIFEGNLEITHDKEQLTIVNTIPIKNHTISCASTEIITCEPEAAKAHIVALETKIRYLKNNTRHPKEPFDVCDGSHCIKYLGIGENKELVELLYPTITNHLIYYKNSVIYPRYHHTCGGKISSAKDVYGIETEPYHIAQSDLKDNKGSENCFHSPSFHWTVEIPISSVIDFLSLEYAGGADNIYVNCEPLKINDEGRILMLRLKGRKVREVQGIDFLEHLQSHYGLNCIKSMRYNFESLRRSLLIRGMGEGHGVGMCLYGADGLAKKGLSYMQILNFYYPTTTIK